MSHGNGSSTDSDWTVLKQQLLNRAQAAEAMVQKLQAEATAKPTATTTTRSKSPVTTKNSGNDNASKRSAANSRRLNNALKSASKKAAKLAAWKRQRTAQRRRVRPLVSSGLKSHNILFVVLVIDCAQFCN